MLLEKNGELWDQIFIPLLILRSPRGVEPVGRARETDVLIEKM